MSEQQPLQFDALQLFTGLHAVSAIEAQPIARTSDNEWVFENTARPL